jgi:hypothetical protein
MPGPSATKSRPRAQSTFDPAVDDEVLVLAVDAGVEDADVHGPGARLDRVCLGRANLLHAPLLRLQRVLRLLRTAAGYAGALYHGELAARQRLFPAREGFPLEVLGRLLDEARAPQRLREERVRRLDDENADLARQVLSHGSAGG